MIGKTLGHYQVGDKLGEGGMGQVRRARDTRLGRDVAIKALPAAFAQGAERLARFEREAQLLAALNHPNMKEGSQFVAQPCPSMWSVPAARPAGRALWSSPQPRKKGTLRDVLEECSCW